MIQCVDQFMFGFNNLPAIFPYTHVTKVPLIAQEAFQIASQQDEPEIQPNGAWVRHCRELLGNCSSPKRLKYFFPVIEVYELREHYVRLAFFGWETSERILNVVQICTFGTRISLMGKVPTCLHGNAGFHVLVQYLLAKSSFCKARVQ